MRSSLVIVKISEPDQYATKYLITQEPKINQKIVWNNKARLKKKIYELI